jgi:ABC-type uncharacterized transport system substrate-binding protein
MESSAQSHVCCLPRQRKQGAPGRRNQCFQASSYLTIGLHRLHVRIDTRWATTNAAEISRHAAELVALASDVILAAGDSTVPPLLQATRTVPIVFLVVTDSVAAGYVDSLSPE